MDLFLVHASEADQFSIDPRDLTLDVDVLILHLMPPSQSPRRASGW